MNYVYLLESESVVGERYVGVTRHTSKFAPWRLVTYIAFSDKRKAELFERYLKSGSGHAFANKRLW
jgi:putative endonuclease